MNRIRAIWRVGWRVAVCALLLLWIFHNIFLSEGRYAAEQQHQDWSRLARAEQWHLAWTIGPEALWVRLCLVHLPALVMSVLLVGLTVIGGVIRWQMVLRTQGLELGLGRATGISMVAQFFNAFLLGSTGGDLIKAYYAARETHHKKTEAVTTVFVDRLIGLWAMLLFAVLMMIPNLSLLRQHRTLGALALFTLSMLVALSGVLGVAFWGGVTRHWPRARPFLRRLPKGEMLERSLDSCRQFGKERAFLVRAVLVSLALNVVWVFQVSVLAGGLGVQVPLIDFFVIVPIIFCVSALPITPSGLGVRENLFVLMLAVPEINVAKTAALSISLLSYASSLFWSVLGGLVYLGLRDKQHLAEVTHDTGAEDSSD